MAVQIDRAIFSPLKSLTTDDAWSVVMGAEPRRGLNVDLDKAAMLDGVEDTVSMGFDASRLVCKEYALIHESTGTGHVLKAFSLAQAKGRDDLNSKLNEVADCIREYEEVSSKQLDEDWKRTTITKVIPNDIREDFQLNGAIKEYYATFPKNDRYISM